MTEVPPKNTDASKRELDIMGVKLMDALRTFRVDGELVGRTTGPVVSQFEVEPAPGVKVRQFANLSNDLALAMRAASIRVVAPIPGRGAVGVEVPNPISEIVSFRELVEHREFQSARAALPIALGKDLEGKPVIADLAKMPHLLIAGATGSGKSVCVNTIITSLVYRHTPKTLRFLMVDPKMVELSVYNTLPHLRHKVITDNRDAASVLKWAVMEMQDRYELLAANGCRNIQDFNKRVQDGAPLKNPKTPERRVRGSRLQGWDSAVHRRHHRRDGGPHDDGAERSGDANRDARTEGARHRDPSHSRDAASERERDHGPHQGEFPEPHGVPRRVAGGQPHDHRRRGRRDAARQRRHAVHSAGQVGAVAVAGRVSVERRHGAFDARGIRLAQASAPRSPRRVSSSRSRSTPKPDILEAVRMKEAAGRRAAEGDDQEVGDRDKLFREAAEVVVQNQQGSTSLLQRRLKVGYGRAARIIDQLHAAGVLGPPDASKPRDVLVGLDQLDHICGPRS